MLRDQTPEHSDRASEPQGSSPEPPGTDLGWLLDDLVARTDHVRQAVLLTADGLR